MHLFPLLPILSLFWLLTVAWLILRAARQSRIIDILKPATGHGEQTAPSVAVIVPARDESANIGPCLKSLLGQAYRQDGLQILAVDDDSSDDTADIVTGLAREHSCLTLVHAPALPANWTGKSHACAIGADHVQEDPRWLCFMDADVRAEPCLLMSAVRAAEEEKLDFLSLAPSHELGSLAERLMIPCGHYVLAFCRDLSRAQAKDSNQAVATGQFMLVRREAYRALGGHTAVRNVICEDLELALLFKRHGYSVCLKDAGPLLRTRMYTGWKSLWLGFTKNLTELLGGPAATLAIATAGVLLTVLAVLLPVIDISSCDGGAQGACIATGLAVAGTAAVLAIHVAGAIHFDIPVWYAFLFPVGYGVGWLMALDSIRRRFGGTVRWKGRLYR